jgi:hypothetical protein
MVPSKDSGATSSRPGSSTVSATAWSCLGPRRARGSLCPGRHHGQDCHGNGIELAPERQTLAGARRARWRRSRWGRGAKAAGRRPTDAETSGLSASRCSSSCPTRTRVGRAVMRSNSTSPSAVSTRDASGMRGPRPSSPGGRPSPQRGRRGSENAGSARARSREIEREAEVKDGGQAGHLPADRPWSALPSSSSRSLRRLRRYPAMRPGRSECSRRAKCVAVPARRVGQSRPGASDRRVGLRHAPGADDKAAVAARNAVATPEEGDRVRAHARPRPAFSSSLPPEPQPERGTWRAQVGTIGRQAPRPSCRHGPRRSCGRLRGRRAATAMGPRGAARVARPVPFWHNFHEFQRVRRAP